jgi:hypothetical protein
MLMTTSATTYQRLRQKRLLSNSTFNGTGIAGGGSEYVPLPLVLLLLDADVAV